MTHYIRLTLNPKSKRWQPAKWIQNRAGAGKWGVMFPGLKGVVDASNVRLETKNG